MRLLNSTTLELAEFMGDDVPPYAILSHTWGKDEVTLRDIQDPTKRKDDSRFAKIQACCKQAAEVDKLDWVWIDTCCIDKTSSAELSEAINSMFVWYKEASVCYAYLSDVPPLDPFLDVAEFSRSRWFTRGWTLQELLAPGDLEFYARDWTELGTKWSLHEEITTITGIPEGILLCRGDMRRYSVAERMSWASARQTTRVEDMAYCLLGIFDINMPLLYGEGRRSFLRLQQEILASNPDYSLFLRSPNPEGNAFCDSPKHFAAKGIRTQMSETCKYSRMLAADIGRFTDVTHPRIVGNTVRLSLLANKEKSLAWMYVFHHDDGMQLVCIEIQPANTMGLGLATPAAVFPRQIYKRTNWDGFVLSPVPRSWEDWRAVVEVNLPAFSRPGTTMISSVPHTPSVTCDFDLILESTPTAKLVLKALEPPYDTQTIATNVFKVVFSLVDWPSKLAFRFGIHQTGAVEGSEQEIAIVFSLIPGLWSCVVHTKAPIPALRELLEQPAAPTGLLDGQSDRTLIRLPEMENYLRIASKRRPNSHKVYVTLLPVPDNERSVARSIRP